MSRRRVRRLLSDAAEGAVPFVAKAIQAASPGKIAPVGAFAGLLAVLAIALLYQADIPSVAADSTLKCYDSFGKVAPCTTQARVSASRFDTQETRFDGPAEWATTALYQQASLPKAAVDQQVSLPASAGDQLFNRATSALAVQRSALPRRRPGLATCERHLIPCFFSALRKGVTHLAAVAAKHARPKRNRL
jgi:hypothetical protein